MGSGLAYPEILKEERKATCVRISQHEVLENKGLSKFCMSESTQEKHGRTSINSGALLGSTSWGTLTGEHWLESTDCEELAGSTSCEHQL